MSFSEKCTDTGADDQELLASANKFMKAFEAHPDVKRVPSSELYLLHRVYIKLAVHSAQGRRTDLVSGETKSRGENSPEDVVENKEKSEGDSEVEIVSLNAIRRGGGFCSWCLDEIEIIADRTGTRLSLTVQPFDDSPMDSDALKSFYHRHGFVHWVRYGVEGLWMLRLPCTQKGKYEQVN